MKKNIMIMLLVTLLIGCEVIFEDNISDEKVNILAPVDGTVMGSGTIMFSWKELEGADEYRVRIATPNFLNAAQLVVDSLVTKTSFSNLLEAGEYEWIVYGINSEYESQEEIYKLTLN